MDAKDLDDCKIPDYFVWIVRWPIMTIQMALVICYIHDIIENAEAF